MNKIYLDKLLEFTHSTYFNYYTKYNKHLELNDEIIKIKQNTSLNEKGTFIKYSFVDLSSLILSIEHDESVLIYPICFNIEENQEWFNLLNALLLILNEDYIKESNIAKKKMLEMADKMYKTHLIIGKNLNEKNYIKICELTNLNLIILNNENNQFRINEFAKPNINKWMVCYKFSNYYFPVWNFEKKYFDTHCTFIKYLQTISKKYNMTPTNNENSSKVDNFDVKINNDADKNNNNKKIITDKIKNNDGYEELVTNENYALYISEAIDIKNTPKQKVKKTSDTNINIIGEKKKTKSNKNIFVTLEQKDFENENLIDEQLSNNNGIENNPIKMTRELIKINIQADDLLEESIFKKTEIIDKNKISKIISNIKSTTKLEHLQAYALDLGLNIISGSTKEGKPKNKTKNEIIDEIKKLQLIL